MATQSHYTDSEQFNEREGWFAIIAPVKFMGSVYLVHHDEFDALFTRAGVPGQVDLASACFKPSGRVPFQVEIK